MNKVVLDSSAILAPLRGEAGAAKVLAVLPEAIVSTVNLSEVMAKLVERGDSDELAGRKIGMLSLVSEPFDERLAVTAGSLRRVTARLGLSLGDRACLALALREGAAVLTADRAWATLDLGVEVVLIR